MLFVEDVGSAEEEEEDDADDTGASRRSACIELMSSTTLALQL